MSSNFIHIELKNKSIKNVEKIMKLFKSSIGIGKINPNYSFIPNKKVLSNKFIFKLKDDPSRGYINQNFKLVIIKNLLKKIMQK